MVVHLERLCEMTEALEQEGGGRGASHTSQSLHGSTQDIGDRDVQHLKNFKFLVGQCSQLERSLQDAVVGAQGIGDLDSSDFSSQVGLVKH